MSNPNESKSPLTCLQPSWAIISAGKTLEAKARLNMALNSLLKPPIPIFWKSQSGLIIDCRTCTLQNPWLSQSFLCTTCTHPLDFPTRFKEEFSAFSNWTVVLGVKSPSLPLRGLDSRPSLKDVELMAKNLVLYTLSLNKSQHFRVPCNSLTTTSSNFLSLKENASCCPTVNTWFGKLNTNSLAISSVSYGSWDVLEVLSKLKISLFYKSTCKYIQLT